MRTDKEGYTTEEERKGEGREEQKWKKECERITGMKLGRRNAEKEKQGGEGDKNATRERQEWPV